MSSAELHNRRPLRKSIGEVVRVLFPCVANLAVQDLLIAIIAKGFARNGGMFIAQVDNCDPDPLEDEVTHAIVNELSHYGLQANESPYIGDYGPYLTCERRDLYMNIVLRLVDTAKAYFCFCNPEDQFRHTAHSGGENQCCNTHYNQLNANFEGYRKFALRLGVPTDLPDLSYVDPICGEIAIDTDDLEDIVLIDHNGVPAPFLVDVIDNHHMQTTMQVRRDIALDTLQEELILYHVLGWQPPVFVHVPAVIDEQFDRFFDELPARKFHQAGYNAKALVNYLTQMIWSHPEKETLFNATEFANLLDLQDFSFDDMTIDYDLLNKINDHYKLIDAR